MRNAVAVCEIGCEEVMVGEALGVDGMVSAKTLWAPLSEPTSPVVAAALAVRIDMLRMPWDLEGAMAHMAPASWLPGLPGAKGPGVMVMDMLEAAVASGSLSAMPEDAPPAPGVVVAAAPEALSLLPSLS
jgi:hypothetical protein